MSVVFIDGPMLTKFVEDSATFEKCIKERFDMLDVNKDGVLSRNELQDDVNDLSLVESALQSKEEVNNLYDVLFEKFDTEKKGTFDLKQFTTLMKEVMIAKADGFGNTPVCILLQNDSLLQKVV
ncbi:hypothetical protein LXL04_001565 [Taraxacum kok-saghyz]